MSVSRNTNSLESKASFGKSKTKIEAEEKAAKEAFAKAKTKLEAESAKAQADSGISTATALSNSEFSVAKTEINRVVALQKVVGNNTLLAFAQRVQSEVLAKINSSSF